ncbi:MAG: hypothetical protein WAS27_01465 [Candidatus Saccharimonadales bacterium]
MTSYEYPRDTSPYIEQTGGMHTYDREAELSGPEATQLARQGLGGARARRIADHHRDALRNGTADSVELPDDKRQAAHEGYKRASEQLAALRAARTVPDTPQQTEPLAPYRRPTVQNPPAAVIRARHEKAARRRAAISRHHE